MGRYGNANKSQEEIDQEYKENCKKLYELKFGEGVNINYNTYFRVPGGWIFKYTVEGGVSTTFIPYNEEFKP
ncbi:MAG: hypothetical protein ACI86H_003095 [bacterium]|jgi:hypothetical protein